MKLSTKTRYGIRALAELALAGPGETMTVKDIAQRQKLSVKYLEQIMTALKAAGLVQAVRGMGGGYTLTRLPEQIDLAAVYAALEGTTAPVECVDSPGECPIERRCPTRQTWIDLRDAVEGVLTRTTLADLARRNRDMRDATVPNYDI